MQAEAILIFLLSTLAVAANGEEIYVFPTGYYRQHFQNCTTITKAMMLIQSNTVLHLLPGSHILNEFVLIHGLSNASLIGAEDVTITCAKDVGLAFVNVTNLTIHHVTITECGLSGPELDYVVGLINNTVDAFFRVPTDLSIAILLGDVKNVNLEQMTVKDTPKPGIGLVGINVVGSSLLKEIVFSNNTYRNCSPSSRISPEDITHLYSYQIGGGAFLIYYDYRSPWSPGETEVRIKECKFLKNRDCSLTAGIIGTGVQISAALSGISYTAGTGSGLSLVFTQMNYSVGATVDSSLFRDNMGQFGAGANLITFSGIATTRILVTNCTFVNGTAPYTDSLEPQNSFGGGLSTVSGLFRYLSSIDQLRTSGITSTGNIDIEISNSIFSNNSARTGGGIYCLFTHFQPYAVQHNNRIKLKYKDCVFLNNTALFGSAMYIYEQNVVIASYLSNPLCQVVASNIYATRNYNPSPAGIRKQMESSGIIDVRYSHFTLSGESTLENNNGTALRARRSLVLLSGNITFRGNVGTFGGAVSLVSFSFLVIRPNTSVAFTNNYATVTGGVFHVLAEDEPNHFVNDCFFFLNTSDEILCYDSSTCSNITELGISITFEGNKAPTGSIVYGSSLKTCYWLRALTNETANLWQFLAQNRHTKDTFKFDTEPSGINQVTTPSQNLTIYSGNKYSAMPGQQFNVTLGAKDGFQQQVPRPITSAVLGFHQGPRSDYFVTSVVGKSNYWYLRNDSSTNVPVRVQGRQKWNVTVAIYTTDSITSVQFEVHLSECLPGFQFSNSESSCVCEPELQENGVGCSDHTHQFTVPNSMWFGRLSEDSTTLVVHRCVFDYCKPGQRVIDAGDFDAQCAEDYHRTGLLCGSCEEGYSIVFGTRRCKQCSNNAYLALILAFAVAGILLIAMIAFLKVSVSDGYLNGLLLYSHTLSPYIFILAPKAPAIFLPVAFLNLNLGIETCFYDGMNSLAYTGFQFVFPFYLYFLMSVIVLLARYIKWPWNTGISAGKMFATLLVLSYKGIFRTCADVLQFVDIRSLNHPHKEYFIRWAADPSVPYFSGWHAVLGTLSVLLAIVYLMTLPLILLFPSKAYSFKYTSKMKPLLDAFFAPYKPRFRFWIGLRLLLGITFSIFSVSLGFPANVFLLATVLGGFLYVQVQIRPYHRWEINATDSFLLTNIVIIMLGVLFFNDEYTHHNAMQLQQRTTIFSAALLSLAYIIFAWVLFYHIFIRLPDHLQERIKTQCRQTKLTERILRLCKRSKDQTLLETDLREIDAYHRFRDEEKETRFEVNVSVLDAPQGSEGTAEITPITPPYQ